MIEQLIKDIKANRCILFLGPQMATFRENEKIWISHTQLYCSRLKCELEESKVPFDAEAVNNPYYLATKFLDGSTEKSRREEQIIEEIYVTKESDIYKDLAIIPFNTIVNFGFDRFMPNALKNAGYAFEFDFYDYKGSEKSTLKVDKNIPLVYNLFGSIDKPDSRIQNEIQQLQFLRNINHSPKLPDDLIGRIKEDAEGPKSYVFLGFNFNEWPFRFLLDTLEIPRPNKDPKVTRTNLVVTPKTDDPKVAVMTHDFYADRFGIDFMDDAPNDFVTNLIDQYKANSFDHKQGYISYCKADEGVKKQFTRNLNSYSLKKKRNISFSDHTMFTPGSNRETECKRYLNDASIYIPFVSSDALDDEFFLYEMNYMLATKKKLKLSNDKKEILIFPIIVRNCFWDDVFSDLEYVATIMLPEKDGVLISSEKNPSDDDYMKMLVTINTKIR